MEKREAQSKRRKTPWVIGTLMVASLAILIILQSTNLWKDFTIDSSSDLILLYALSSLNFIAFVIFAFIFLRSIIKLMRERRTLELGSQIKTRLLLYFVALSLLPIIAMAVFSYLFMNRALERWFTQIPENAIREAREVRDQSVADRFARLDESAKMVASSLNGSRLEPADLEQVSLAGNLIYIGIVSKSGVEDVAFRKRLSEVESVELERTMADAVQLEDSAPSLRDGRGFDIAIAEMDAERRLIIIPEPFDQRGVSQFVENSVAEFERLKQKQVVIRQVGLLTLGVLTFMLIFASSWIAFHVARGITLPIKALAEGADEIAQGNFGHRVDTLAEDELALLISTFNDMSTKLESNSLELQQRRRYIETVLETLPTGVVSVDADDRVTTINRAAVNILRLDKEDHHRKTLASLLTRSQDLESLNRIVARARRIGNASDQLTLPGSGTEGELIAALTATRLPADDGVVLVIEDLSELISAQRASAWQEVARRMAHEIKNPLTPIQLSAERMAKRFAASESGTSNASMEDRGDMGSVVYDSTATILREVATLKSMVDEFSQFARLPDVSLERGSVNAVINEAVSIFSDRFDGIQINRELADELPEISLDPQQLKRVFINLIQNSIEAFEGKGDKGTITISTRFERARDRIIADVTDNAKGIDPRDLQQLFQPYFSTKDRGTGLGLAIVKRIVADHGGTIKTVRNQPKGAKFILELPANT